jgi:hypothetical protein
MQMISRKLVFFQIFYGVWRNVKKKKPNHIFWPPQFSTSHHKPTKPHHKFNRNYQIHHQPPQIQSKFTITNTRINPQTAKNKAKPTTSARTNLEFAKNQAEPTTHNQI